MLCQARLISCDRPDKRAQRYMPLLRSSDCLQRPNDNTAQFTNE